MEPRSRTPAITRSTAAFLAVSLLVVAAVRVLELAPSPYGNAAAAFLRLTGPVSTAVVVLLLIVSLAGIAAMQGRTRDLEPSVREEPWLDPPRLPRSRARCPLIGFASLEPAVGASSIAFNLAVLIATEGAQRGNGDRGQRPRPLCLLSEGPLTEGLGLSPESLREHLATYPGRVTEEVVELAVRHPSGCELLCLSRGQLGRHQLRLMRDAVERYYDALIVDCPSLDSRLREGIEDVADAIVLVGFPTLTSAEASLREAERAQAGHRSSVTALLVNRIRANQDLPTRMGASFENAAFIAEDSAVVAMDRQAMPWCLNAISPASHQLRLIATALLPDLMAQDRHAP